MNRRPTDANRDFSTNEPTALANTSVQSSLFAVFHDLQQQVTDLEDQGYCEAQIASAVQSILDVPCSLNCRTVNRCNSTSSTAASNTATAATAASNTAATNNLQQPIDRAVAPLAFRLAWLIAVYAPCFDPVLVVTLPFCLESILDGYATIDDMFEHIASSDPLPDAPMLPRGLSSRSVGALGKEIRRAVFSLRSDPTLHDRIIARIAGEEIVGEEMTGEEQCSDLWHPRQTMSCAGTARVMNSCTSANRWPTRVREAVVSVLQTEQISGDAHLFRQISGRLDARSVRRLAGELVSVSADDETMTVRLRAAASLLEMNRLGQLDHV